MSLIKQSRDIISIIRTLYSSESSFLEEYNSIVAEYLITHVRQKSRKAKLNNKKWIQNLRAHIKFMIERFDQENLAQSEMMLLDMQNSEDFMSNVRKMLKKVFRIN